jgi:GH15 family glucan-1,4-alpha-glucosidase
VYFRPFEASDLTVHSPIGGIARYEGDIYHHKGGDYPGNPWIITTLWYAEYLILNAKGKDDLKKAEEILVWVTNHASPSGILSEQLDPYSGNALSASPLIWSHAAFVTTVLLFIERAKEMEKL